MTTRLHDTLLASQSTLQSLNEKLASAAAVARDHVPKNGKEAQDLAREVLEQLEKAKDVIAKQSGELVSRPSVSLHCIDMITDKRTCTLARPCLQDCSALRREVTEGSWRSQG